MWWGDLPVRHVLYLAEHLVLNPHSRVFAIRGGDPALQGWDAAAVIAARTHNLIASIIAGFMKEPDDSIFIRYPGSTPEETQPKEIRPATLADITAAGFSKFMYG